MLKRVGVCTVLGGALAACGASADSADTAAGVVSVTGSAVDTDGGSADADDQGDPGGSESEGNADSGEGPPPEEEDEADFRVPQASGRFVYTASELTDSVAVIDSDNLSIEVVGVGRGPTVVEPIAGAMGNAGAVAVLDQGSDDVALVRTAENAVSDVRIVEITPGANNLAVAPGGRFVFAYHDVDGPQMLGPGSDQELTVIDVDSGAANVMTVGAHPRAVAFRQSGETAYVVTADGVNVVDLSVAMLDGKPDIVPVHTNAAVDPELLEVLVAGEHGIALARVDGDSSVVVTDLETRAQDVIELPGIPTDVDIAPNESFAILTVPSVEGSRFFELPLPVTSPSAVFEQLVSGEYVGLSQISPDGSTLILYTTQNPFEGGADPGGGGGGGGGTTTGTTGDGGTDTDTDTDTAGSTSSSTGEPPEPPPNPDAVDPSADPRLRVTIARRDGAGWDASIALFVDRPVDAVGVGPDSANGILVHEQVEEDVPYAYTLVDLAKDFPDKKLQTVEVEPGAILFTPGGDRAVVLLTDNAGVRRVDQVDLRSFIVRSLGLGSPPRAAGYVEVTDKVFVSQDHATGRITFIDAIGSVQTITGFRLGDAVKD